MSTSYYQPSGRVAPVAWLLAPLFALAIAPGAWAYAWLTIQLPFVLNVVVTVAFGLYLGWLVRQVVTEGRVRNLLWTGRANIVFALLGWYCQWAAWLALKGQGSTAPSALERFLALLADPLAMGHGAVAILVDGKPEAGGWVLSAIGMVLLWLLELGLLIVFSGPLGTMRAEQPFCEVSNRWAEVLPVPVQFAPVDPATIASQLEADPAQARRLLLPLAAPDTAQFTRAKLYRCPGSDPYLSLGKVTRTSNAKGKVEEKEVPVFDYLRLPGIDADELRRHWSAAADADADHRETVPAAAEAPVAPELDTALAHLKAERFEEALARAASSTGSNQLALRTDANRICALACSRLGHWPEARGYWQALDADEPTAHNALQVATSSVMAGELAEGVLAVELARERNEENGEMPGMMILTGFVTALTQTGHLREAMPYVDPIRQAYLSAGTTDPTLLFAAGMPPFGVFLDKSLPVVRAAHDEQKARRWYASMLPRLDEGGQAELDAWLERVFESAPGQDVHS